MECRIMAPSLNENVGVASFMKIKTFTFNPFQTNCYVCQSNGEAVIIDPSCYEEWEIQELVSYIESDQLSVKYILLTHGHVDHIFGCNAMTKAFGKGFLMHRADSPLLIQAPMHAQLFGTSIEEVESPEAYLEEGGTIEFGDENWDIVYTPGHSPGSVCFVDNTNRLVLSGDVLFYDSIGRTDLWQGSLPVLMQSIFNKVMVLDDDYKLYPGHGPATTVGRERMHNPFLLEK